MINACASLVDDGIIRGVLTTVDCQTRAYAEGGYLALTTGSSVFQAALTGLLTIYVALLGYRMLFAQGDMRLSDAPGIALKIGAILALVTSWATFQTMVFDVFDRAPLEIAAIVSTPLQDSAGSALASQPMDGLQAAYDEMTQTAVAFGRLAGPDAKAYSSPAAAAAEASSMATGVLFMSTAGVISATRLAIGVLTAIGPIFIALALIPATRGLFVGWVRALAAAGLTSLVAWLLVVLMLAVLDPWLTTLAEQRRDMQLNPQTATSAAALIFVFGFGQAAVSLGAIMMALGFNLPNFQGDRRQRGGRGAAGPQAARVAVEAMPSRPERLALELQRDQAQSVARVRAASAAAAASTGGSRGQVSVTVQDTPRLGEVYRRPAIAPRRAGATR